MHPARVLAAASLLVCFQAFATIAPCSTSELPEAISSGDVIFVELQPVAGIEYLVVASAVPDFNSVSQALEQWPVQTLSFQGSEGGVFNLFIPRVSSPRQYKLWIMGFSAENGRSLACETRRSYPLAPAPELRSTDDRVVIPVAGAVAGLFGSQFRTSLRLRGFGTGTIYFRPRGHFHGDERDPHVEYDLGPIGFAGIPGILDIPDINDALGVIGIGNLDIIPDFLDEPVRGGYLAPEAEARIYNDSSSGPYGAVIQALDAEQLSRDGLHLVVPPDFGESARVNVGLRTFEGPADVTTYLFLNELDSSVRLGTKTLDPNTFDLVPIENLLWGYDAEPGDILFFDFQGGAVAACYSVTDQQSGDPIIYVDPDSWEGRRVREVVIEGPWR